MCATPLATRMMPRCDSILPMVQPCTNEKVILYARLEKCLRAHEIWFRGCDARNTNYENGLDIFTSVGPLQMLEKEYIVRENCEWLLIFTSGLNSERNIRRNIKLWTSRHFTTGEKNVRANWPWWATMTIICFEKMKVHSAQCTLHTARCKP